MSGRKHSKAKGPVSEVTQPWAAQGNRRNLVSPPAKVGVSIAGRVTDYLAEGNTRIEIWFQNNPHTHTIDNLSTLSPRLRVSSLRFPDFRRIYFPYISSDEILIGGSLMHGSTMAMVGVEGRVDIGRISGFGAHPHGIGYSSRMSTANAGGRSDGMFLDFAANIDAASTVFNYVVVNIRIFCDSTLDYESRNARSVLEDVQELGE